MVPVGVRPGPQGTRCASENCHQLKPLVVPQGGVLGFGRPANHALGMPVALLANCNPWWSLFGTSASHSLPEGSCPVSLSVLNSLRCGGPPGPPGPPPSLLPPPPPPPLPPHLLPPPLGGFCGESHGVGVLGGSHVGMGVLGHLDGPGVGGSALSSMVITRNMPFD
jgi:hypothetical protein